MSIVSNNKSTVIEDFPSEEPSAEDIDALLNSELCQLSLDERNKVFQDIHGVSDEINETPDLVAESHRQLDLEIEKIKEKSAYDLACSIDRKYVMDKDLRIRFLRSTLFDAKAAATKMVQFFEMKRDLFGQGELARDITQNDLSNEDLTDLYNGQHQLLPVRDSAGRGVLLWLTAALGTYWIPSGEDFPSNSADFDKQTQNRLRCAFYSSIVDSEDEAIQKAGLVVVSFSTGKPPKLSSQMRKRQRAMAKFLQVMPSRINEIHFCYDHPMVGIFLRFFKFAVNTFTRVRVRTHYGKS